MNKNSLNHTNITYVSQLNTAIIKQVVTLLVYNF